MPVTLHIRSDDRLGMWVTLSPSPRTWSVVVHAAAVHGAVGACQAVVQTARGSHASP